MSIAAAGRVARVAPLRRARPPARRASRSPVAASAFPVFEKMVGTWEDNIRYIEPELEKTPVKLVGVREFAIDGDVVTLKSSTRFPNGKTLRLAFEGRRVKEAYGLKNVVRFDRVPWDEEVEEEEECEFPKTAPDDCYYPIVLLAAEHPAILEFIQFDQSRFSWIHYNSAMPHWHHLNDTSLHDIDIQVRSENGTIFNHSEIGEYNLVLVFECVVEDEFSAEFIKQYNREGYNLAHTPERVSFK
jgi:hypothetical protein